MTFSDEVSEGVWDEFFLNLKWFLGIQSSIILLSLLSEINFSGLNRMRMYRQRVSELHPHILSSARSVFNVFQFLFSVLQTVFWILSVVYDHDLSSYDWIDYLMTYFFIVHYIFRVRLLDKVYWGSIYRGWNMLDIFVIISSFLSLQSGNQVSFVFLRMLLAMRAAEILTEHFARKYNLPMVSIRVVLLTYHMATVICAMALVMFVVENLGDPPGLDYSTTDADSFTVFTSIYFMFITLTTVGYGDVSPSSFYGRVFVAIFVVVGIVLFTTKLSEIGEALDRRSKGLDSFKPYVGEHFVIISGNPQFSTIRDLLEVMFHKDLSSNSEIVLSRVVILSPCVGNETFKAAMDSFIVRNLHMGSKVVMLDGSPLDPVDLNRASAHNAAGCFIISNTSAVDVTDDDTANILRALAISEEHRHLRNNIFLTVRGAEFLEVLPALGFSQENCVFSDVLLNACMAYNCTVPGFSTLLYTLCVPYANDESPVDSWEKEYLNGVGREMYTLVLCEKYTENSMSFSELASLMYTNENRNLILVGVSLEGHVFINPAGISFQTLRDTARQLSQNDPKFPWVGDSRVIALVIANDARETRSFGCSVHESKKMTSIEIFPGSPKVPGSPSSIARKQLIGHYEPAEVPDLVSPSIPRPPGDSFQEEDAPPPLRKFLFARRRSSNVVPELSGHIVLICSAEEMIVNFLSITKSYTRTLQRFSEKSLIPENLIEQESLKEIPIVILYESLSAEFVAEVVHHNVFAVRGNPRTEEALEGVFAHQAKTVVILGSSSSRQRQAENGVEDVENLFVHLKVQDFLSRRQVTSVDVLGSLESESSLRFLKYGAFSSKTCIGDPDPNASILLNPMFANGQIYSNRLSQLFLNMSFYNKGVMLFINELFWHGYRELRDDKRIDGGCVTLVNVPEGIRTFGQMLSVSSVSWGGIPIGILRSPNHRWCRGKNCSKTLAPFEHIIVGPTPSCNLCPHDRIYCLLPTRIM